MEVVESETTIYIMTERVRPLTSVLPLWSGKAEREREEWLLWGLHRVSVRLQHTGTNLSSPDGEDSFGIPQ